MRMSALDIFVDVQGIALLSRLHILRCRGKRRRKQTVEAVYGVLGRFQVCKRAKDLDNSIVVGETYLMMG